MKKLSLVVSVLAVMSGCSYPNLKSNVNVSTKSAPPVKVLGPVRVETCNLTVVLFPFWKDPADSFEELMAQSRGMGGNAVVDYRRRTSSTTMVYPFFAQFCIEETGQAAVIE